MCPHHCWLHFASSTLSFFAASTPKTLSQKANRLPLHSLRGRKTCTWSLFSREEWKPGTASNFGSLCRWCVSFFPYTLICLEKKQICDMTGVCLVSCFVLFSQRSDYSFFFFFTPLGRARVSFKSFNSGFLRNLSVWHVCHFSESSNESWQFSHNGVC